MVHLPHFSWFYPVCLGNLILVHHTYFHTPHHWYFLLGSIVGWCEGLAIWHWRLDNLGKIISIEFVRKPAYPTEVTSGPTEILTGHFPGNYKSNIQLIPTATRQAGFVAAIPWTCLPKTRNFCSDGSVGSMLLGYDPMWIDSSQPVIRRNLLPPFSE